MAAAGAAVVTCARTGSEAESAAAEIRAAGGRAIGLTIDTADKAQCDLLVERAVGEFGRLHIMHCNASIDRPQPADQVDPASLEKVLAVNIGGYLFSAQAAARQMRHQGTGGAIVPMRRRGRVEEVVGPAIFLASDASSFMTGVVMPASA
jgi:NAD(P)-dependent dehydrogenase (short-subunit alcohol dehydrogenase family)